MQRRRAASPLSASRIAPAMVSSLSRSFVLAAAAAFLAAAPARLLAQAGKCPPTNNVCVTQVGRGNTADIDERGTADAAADLGLGVSGPLTLLAGPVPTGTQTAPISIPL